MNIFIDNFLGWLTLLIILIFILFWSSKYPKIKNILLIAFFVRSLLVLGEQYGIFKLPDGNLMLSDANRFELLAREMSRSQGLSVIKNFLIPDSFLLARVLSIFYTLFGESVMMAKGIGVGFGTGAVLLVYKFSTRLWSQKVGVKSAWMTALFPTLVLYSAITLREVYVVFFLIVCLIGIDNYIKKKTILSLVQTFLSFYILTLLHGPAGFGAFIFLLYLTYQLFQRQIIQIINFKINLISIFYIVILFSPIYLYINSYFSIPYLGNINELTDFERIIEKANVGLKNDASYPNWVRIDNYYEIIPKTLIKVIYFLYSPFVWDIKEPHHLIGLFDASFYFVLTFLILKNWTVLWSNPTTRIIILIFFIYIVIYGLGLGNFGTVVRHRSKFVIMLIVLAAPKLKNIVLRKIN